MNDATTVINAVATEIEDTPKVIAPPSFESLELLGVLPLLPLLLLFVELVVTSCFMLDAGKSTFGREV